MYLDHEVLGRRSAQILKFKKIDASILPYLNGMSTQRKYVMETCLFVTKMDVPKNMGTFILQQIMRHISWPVRHAALTLRAIDLLTTEENARTVCENMGHVMQLWMRCPNVPMNNTLDMVKAYMRECEVDSEVDSDYE
jgi:hypothetical protein